MYKEMAKLTCHAWKRCEQRDIDKKLVDTAVECGWRKDDSKRQIVTYEFGNLLVHCSAIDGRVITLYRSDTAAFQCMDPPLTFDQYKAWHRIIRLVWNYDNAESIFVSCCQDLSDLVELLVDELDNEEIKMLFTCKLALAAQETIPVVDILSLLVGRKDEPSLEFLEARFGLKAVRAFGTTATYVEIERKSEKNLLTPFFGPCSIENGTPAEELGVLTGLIEDLPDDPCYRVVCIQQCDMNGWNPLIWASYRCSQACPIEQLSKVHVLLSYGASVLVKERRGWTPLHTAAMGGSADCVRLLLSWRKYCCRHFVKVCQLCGTEPSNASTVDPERLLSLSLQESDWQEFMPEGSELQTLGPLFETFRYQRNPYYFGVSILLNGIPIIDKLSGNDIPYVDVADWNNNTAVHWCGNVEVLRVLATEFSANVNVQERRYQCNAVLQAVFNEKEDIAKFLLEEVLPNSAMDLLAVDKHNKSALDLAIEKCKVSNKYGTLNGILVALTNQFDVTGVSLHYGVCVDAYGSVRLNNSPGVGVVSDENIVWIGVVECGQQVVVVVSSVTKTVPASSAMATSRELKSILLVAPVDVITVEDSLVDRVVISVRSVSNSARSSLSSAAADTWTRGTAPPPQRPSLSEPAKLAEAKALATYQCQGCGCKGTYDKEMYESKGYPPRKKCDECKRKIKK